VRSSSSAPQRTAIRAGTYLSDLPTTGLADLAADAVRGAAILAFSIMRRHEADPDEPAVDLVNDAAREGG